MRVSYFKGVDWVVLTLYISLVLIGWLMLYSASYEEGGPIIQLDSKIGRHSIWVLIGFVAFVVVQTIEWKAWYTLAIPIYAICLLLLIGVLIFGVEIKGAKAWYSIFGFSFQPAELAKFGTALVLASFLSLFDSDIRKPRTLLFCLLFISVPALLILLQPDAGSAIIFSSFFLLFFIRGLSPIYYLAAGLLMAVLILSLVYSPLTVVITTLLIAILILCRNLKRQLIVLPLFGLWVVASVLLFNSGLNQYVIYANVMAVVVLLLYNYFNKNERTSVVLGPLIVLSVLFSYGAKFSFENFLQDHQQERINVWLRPDKCDPRGSLYNVLQSKNAIESGGWKGAGYTKGTMSRLNYVPEQTTDFIFSLVGEEQGFIGVLSVIIMFFLLMTRMIYMARRAKNEFIANYIYGIAGIFFLHVFINIGMSMGIMPVIGIPLPFFSMGGSSLLVFSIMIGVMLKMDLSRHYR